jgi:ADP-ribosyl-[dinitrogen reductase] hydrolase
MINTATKPATLVGCGIGDALGVPWEMKSPLNPNLQNWDGLFKDGATFHKWAKAGMWSDDTLMTIALAKSIIECNGYDPANAAQKYLDWFNSNNPRGMGSTTGEALCHLKLGSTWNESGVKGERVCGNGTAMRSSPLGLAFKDIKRMQQAAFNDAIITHNNLEPQVGSFAVAVATNHLLSADTTHDLIIKAGAEVERYGFGGTKVHDQMLIAQSCIDDDLPANEALAKIGTTGYVVHTVAAALYCVAKTSSFKDCVVMAVKGGGDADTTAAIAGGLAGTFYGIEGIPEEYKTVEDFDLLAELTNSLMAVRNKGEQ